MANGVSGEVMGTVASNVEMTGSRSRQGHASDPRMAEGHALACTLPSETAMPKTAVRYNLMFYFAMKLIC